MIFSDDPFRDYNFLTKFFQPNLFPTEKNYAAGINSNIDETAVIYPGVVIGNNCIVGPHTILYPNVVLYDHSEIGSNVIIHANTTIGSDAFYFKKRPDHYEKMHSCGKCVISDWVEIGAGCTIDRGVSGNTVIGKGTKLDNQIHIGHDTIVGENCIFAAQVGIAGVTKVEDDVILWGQVGVTKDIVIGKGAVVSAKSGVSKSLEAGKSYFGVPAKEFRKAYKELATIAKLAEEGKR